MTSLRGTVGRALVVDEAETAAYGNLSISFDDRVLRPRSWTTLQSEWAAEMLPAATQGSVLEVCAGVGHIGLLAISASPRSLVQVDMNAVACDFARQNAAAAGLSSWVEVRHGRMEDALDGAERFVMIVADPPWVRSDRTFAFPEDPLAAIDGGVDGLDVARTCLDVIGRHLDDTGSALLQLGTAAQIEAVDAHLQAHRGLRLQVRGFREHPHGNIVVHLIRSRTGHA